LGKVRGIGVEGGIGSLWHDCAYTGSWSKDQVCGLSGVVPWERSSYGVVHAWHWRGPRGCTKGQCWSVRGQLSHELLSKWVGIESFGLGTESLGINQG